MDAANIDLKGFSEDFYRKLAAGHLDPVKETLLYVCNETDVWVELTTLLIPGWNDSEAELAEMARWVSENLGSEVPMHFTAFHPDFRLRDLPPTPPSTLRRRTSTRWASRPGRRHRTARPSTTRTTTTTGRSPRRKRRTPTRTRADPVR